MRKKIIRLVLVMAMVFMQIGCKKNVGTPEDNAVTETEEVSEEELLQKELEEASVVFGFSCCNLSNPYYNILKEAIQTETDNMGIGMIVKDAEMDSRMQEQQIQEMIELHVSAVIVCPVDRDAITPALQALKDAGIPVVNVDTRAKETDLVQCFVGTDNKEAGGLCGDDLQERLPDGGKVMIFETDAQNAMSEYISGFEETIANKGFEVVERVQTEDSKETAKKKMAEYLKENKEIQSVMCASDQIALGVVEALEEAGIKNVYVYGVGGSPQAKKLINKENSLLAGTAAPGVIEMGITAAKDAIYLNSDQSDEAEEETMIDTVLIDKNNVQLYGCDGWK